MEAQQRLAGDRSPASIRIGTVGWGYDDWLDNFYPAKTAKRDYLVRYARAFDTVEIDSSFYGTPAEATVRHWRASTPENFRFCPKVPRLITHDCGLRDVAEPMRQFVRVMGLLGPKRGPMLIQLPPSFTRMQLPDLKAFLPLLKALNDPTARFAIEFRHRSLIGGDISDLLREHGIALVAADYAGMPRRFEVTADFVYLRMIGKHQSFPRYDAVVHARTPDIARWAEAIRLSASRISDAYILCNNDYEGHSPTTCNTFQSLLGLEVSQGPAEVQGSLF